MASLTRTTPSIAPSTSTVQQQSQMKALGANPSIAKSALNVVASHIPAPAGPTSDPADVEGANGKSNNLSTYVDPGQTAAGKAATGAAQAAIDTEQQAAKMGEQAAQGMFQQNTAAGSHLSGGLGSAAMAAAGQQHLNNINAYNSQLAAWQQGVASAQQNLGSMEAGFGTQAGANATAALGNVQSAQAAGTPTTLSNGSGGGAGGGPDYTTTTSQTALNTGATNEVSTLNTFATGNGSKKWNAQGVASRLARKASGNITALQNALGQYKPGTPEYSQIAKALQDWENYGNALMNLGYDSRGGYSKKNAKGQPDQASIGADALNAAGQDPSKDPLPADLHIQGL